MTRRPDQDPLARRLGDHGSRLPGEPSPGLSRAVLDRLDGASATLPPDRPARRRRLAAGALLTAAVAATLWSDRPRDGSDTPFHDVVATSRDGHSGGVTIDSSTDAMRRPTGGVTSRDHDEAAIAIDGAEIAPRWIAVAPQPRVPRRPAVDAPPAGPDGALRLPPFPRQATLDPLVAIEQPLQRELSAVTAEAGALAVGLFDRAALPLMKLGMALRGASRPH